tara:strand:+ start:218 stop:736 length:519 start_codon:yes stop_codon:yes gene_type:complete
MSGANKLEKNRNPDVNEHLGFLRQWAAQMKRGGSFSKWDLEELFNQAYVTAADLLEKNYNPEKGSVTTYLKAFLWSRVSYAYGKSFGWRYRDRRWVFPEQSGTELEKSYTPQIEAELPPTLNEEEKKIIEMRLDGMSYKQIATELGYGAGGTIANKLRTTVFLKFVDSGLTT